MKSKVSILVILFSLVLMCFTVSAYAAPSVEGFMGVPWGASRQQVEAAMAEQGFEKLAKPEFCSSFPQDPRCDPNLLRYSGQFAGEQAEVNCSIQNKAMVKGWVSIKSFVPFNLTGQMYSYTRIRGLLTQKYGPPTSDSPGEFTADARWLLTSGEAGGDQVEIQIIIAKAFKTGYTSTGTPVGQPGWIEIHYINRSLQERLLNSNL